MGQISRIWISAMIAAAMFAAHGVASATDNFARVSLPKGVSIELPKNWVVLSGNQRITLDSAVESGLDLSGIEQESSDLPFAANYYDDKGNTLGLLNVRYYPQLGLSCRMICRRTARSKRLTRLKDLFFMSFGILHHGQHASTCQWKCCIHYGTRKP